MGLGHATVFDPSQAKKAVNALRDGVPPPDEIAEWLTVGQADLSDVFAKAFGAVTHGGFDARLIVGVPGAGKSHFFARLRRMADRHRCLLSYCVQDRTTRTTLNRPDLVYRELVSQTQVPSSFGNSADALATVLQEWAARALPVVSAMAPALGRLYALEKAGLVPSPVTTRVPRRTGLALVGYLLAIQAQNSSAQARMLDVFRGLKIENRAVIEIALSLGLLHARGIRWTPGPYDTDYWLGQFVTLCHIARAAGLAGTVLLLDELESLIDLPRRNSRAKAYGVLHALLINDYSAPGLLTACAFTPAFVSGLRHDIAGFGHKYHREWAQVWKDRYSEIQVLSREEACELVTKIAHLYTLAFGWNGDRFVRNEADSVVESWLRTRAPVGDLVRLVVSRLDVQAI